MYGYCRTLLIEDVDGTERHYYGVDRVDCETLAVLDSAPGLTDDWLRISRYVKDMNRFGLFPEHFHDVAEDIMYGNV